MFDRRILVGVNVIGMYKNEIQPPRALDPRENHSRIAVSMWSYFKA